MHYYPSPARAPIPFERRDDIRAARRKHGNPLHGRALRRALARESATVHASKARGQANTHEPTRRERSRKKRLDRNSAARGRRLAKGRAAWRQALAPFVYHGAPEPVRFNET